MKINPEELMKTIEASAKELDENKNCETCIHNTENNIKCETCFDSFIGIPFDPSNWETK